MLLHTKDISSLLLNSLTVWCNRIVPSLFAFLFCNTLLLQTGLDILLLEPFLTVGKKIFSCSQYGCYCIISGFLFGFPVGAKTISEYRLQEKISYKEANVLMAFCNQFSPGYYTGLIIPILEIHGNLQKYGFILLIYFLPLLYGFLLLRINNIKGEKNCLLIENSDFTADTTKKTELSSILTQTTKSLFTIGEYMLFSTLLSSVTLLLPVSQTKKCILQSFFEISSGMQILINVRVNSCLLRNVLICLLLFSQGVSGNLQIIHYIKEARLSIPHFLFHRAVLCLIACICSFFLFRH